MRHFAELRRQGDTTATERLFILEQHQRSLEQQMQKLELHMKALQEKIGHKKASLAQRGAASHSVYAPEQSEVEAETFDSESR